MGFSLFIQSWFPHIPFKMATWWSMKLLDHVFPHKLLKPQIQTIHNDLPTISKNGLNLQLEVCWVCLSHYTSTLISTTIKEHVAWNLNVIIPFWKKNNHQQPHIVEFKWKAWHEAVPRPDDIGLALMISTDFTNKHIGTDEIFEAHMIKMITLVFGFRLAIDSLGVMSNILSYEMHWGEIRVFLVASSMCFFVFPWFTLWIPETDGNISYLSFWNITNLQRIFSQHPTFCIKAGA